MFIKIIGGVLALVLMFVSGMQSYMILSVGVANQTPQLIGDGGAGMVFAFLLLLGAVLFITIPLIAVFTLLLAGIEGIFGGILYQDNMMLIWGFLALVLALLGVFAHLKHRKIKRQKSTYNESSSLEKRQIQQ